MWKFFLFAYLLEFHYTFAQKVDTKCCNFCFEMKYTILVFCQDLNFSTICADLLFVIKVALEAAKSPLFFLCCGRRNTFRFLQRNCWNLPVSHTKFQWNFEVWHFQISSWIKQCQVPNVHAITPGLAFDRLLIIPPFLSFTPQSSIFTYLHLSHLISTKVPSLFQDRCKIS